MQSLNSFISPRQVIIEKWPWRFSDEPYQWWKYLKRPHVSYAEYQYLSDNLVHAKNISLTVGAINVLTKHKKSSVPAQLMGVSHSFNDTKNLSIVEGRYFSLLEAKSATDIAIIGHTIAKELGILDNPIGKYVLFRKRKYNVVGVIKREGNTLIGSTSDDDIYIPYKSFQKIVHMRRRQWWVSTRLVIDGLEEDKHQQELEGEVRMLMRAYRSLRPIEEDNFAVNRSEMAYDFMSNLISILTVVGAVIGSFAVVVGAFNIANIMFISVQERTFQIGLQKALGAKRAFILMQFLLESVFLTLVGGVVGILLVYVVSFIPMGVMELKLTFKNVAVGVTICVITGVLAGIIPAYRASRLDSIEALRA